MSLYDFPCEYCEGTVRERVLEREPISHHRGIVVLEAVPIGVCDRCGAHYYAAPILKRKNMPVEVDEMACGFIRLEGGRVIAVEICWDSHNAPVQEARIYGDKGGCSLFPAKIYRGEDILESVELSTQYGGYPVFEAYEHFIDCIRDPKKKMIASGEEIVDVMRMLDGIGRSAATGREVTLK